MPLYLQKDIENGNRIAVWKATESVDELTEMATLSKEDEKKLSSFRLDSRKKEWLAVRILIKELLGESRQIYYKSSGAPYFKGSNMEIGISHTMGYAGIALATFPVSLDMEKATPRIERVFERFVNDNEKEFIPPEKKPEYYNLIWCAKETLFKLLDRRDVVFKDNLKIRPLTMSDKGLITADIDFPDLRCEVTMGYEVLPDFTLVYYIKHFGDDIR